MRITLLSISFLITIGVVAQSADFVLGHTIYQSLEMEDIRSDDGYYSTFKPFARKSVYDFLDKNTNQYFKKEMREFSGDSSRSRKPVLAKLYQFPADLFYYHDRNLDLHVNPALQFSLGNSNEAGTNTLFVNSRGLEIRGTIDEKVAFYTYLSENQARYPQYVNAVRDSTITIPYEGFWKQFNETGVDFLRAQGYIDFGLSESISAQLGYGKHFVGNGVRTLILSDYSNNYPYLRINTQTKLFDYTNVFAELIADVQGGSFGVLGASGFSKKYMALHQLNIKIRPNLTIGLFESIMYGDSVGGLKLEYLNPIIFYRVIEQQNGSEDNAFVGLDFKWNIKKRVSLYGQLAIDELVVSEVLSRNGWWGNKQGIQFGAKYIDALGVENLMVQGELNKVRPYMYAHEDGFTSYSHYNLALAHPLGANFTEYLGRVAYPPNEKWNIEGVLILASYGNDLDSINFGRDILKKYLTRRQNTDGVNIDYGNDHLQGNKTELALALLRTSYMWKHNFFIDLEATLRKEKDTNGFIDIFSTIFGLSLRWNVPARRYLF